MFRATPAYIYILLGFRVDRKTSYFLILEFPEIHFQFKNNSRKNKNRFKSLKNISKIPKIEGQFER
jgi:hypothetical protein